jgi:quercetin dioxygenase-like cupin family protein
LRSLSCHTSVLIQNHCPHPPHQHKEEEILLLLTGEVDLILPDWQFSDGARRKRLQPGELVYYPAQFAHTLQTTSDEPANYLMIKWHDTDKSTAADSPFAFNHSNLFSSADDSAVEAGFHPRLVFEGPTNYLRKLQCHVSTLTPGAGYEPHIDAYDVLIIVLEGEIETLGERMQPHSVIFYPAGEPHGMLNPGDTVAKYVVFEFHGSHWELPQDSDNSVHLSRAKASDLRSLKRNLKRLLKFPGRVVNRALSSAPIFT